MTSMGKERQMNSTPNLKAAEADDVLVARADERLAHAYEQIARADEQLARVTQKLSEMEQDATRHPAAVLRLKPSRGGQALRGLFGLLLAACIVVAAFASQSSYGDAAKLMISRWVPPHLVSALSLPPEKSIPSAQPGPATVQVAAAQPAPQQAISSSSATTQDVVPTVGPTSAELAQLVQTMMRVLENVEQEVHELKVGQERMASDNAKVIEQFRASQEQMTRLLARTSDQNLASKTSPPLPRPIAARKPAPTHPSPQARAQPPGPVRLDPDEQ
jgi:hypothetical protein